MRMGINGEPNVESFQFFQFQQHAATSLAPQPEAKTTEKVTETVQRKRQNPVRTLVSTNVVYMQMP